MIPGLRHVFYVMQMVADGMHISATPSQLVTQSCCDQCSHVDMVHACNRIYAHSDLDRSILALLARLFQDFDAASL